MTVFVLANASDRHRLGITASRKAIGNAVQRNRSKRLVREAFRATEALLSQLELKYDWVINSKQKLLTVSSKVAADEFARIVLSVSKDEAKQDERRMV
jgi:ribonuclease P protein component